MRLLALLGPFTDGNDILQPLKHLLLIYLKPEKGTPFRRSLPVRGPPPGGCIATVRIIFSYQGEANLDGIGGTVIIPFFLWSVFLRFGKTRKVLDLKCIKGVEIIKLSLQNYNFKSGIDNNFKNQPRLLKKVWTVYLKTWRLLTVSNFPWRATR